MNRAECIAQINRYAATGQPFFFLIDFEQERPIVCRLEEVYQRGFMYDIKGSQSLHSQQGRSTPPQLQICDLPVSRYGTAFQQVQSEIRAGNSFLLNLTFPTPIRSNYSLRDIYHFAKAKYKLYASEQGFVVFSPECFVKIRDGYIYSYPMKGTIDAALPNAEQQLLGNEKERWEHNTIVDLIRNDLSMVAREVRVTRFRYLDRIQTERSALLQASSEIRGRLPEHWRQQLGDLLFRLLPAGSVSGAPKKKTLEIIRAAEQQKRGYYTGIFGVFNGQHLDSAVNIRYIEEREEQLYYRSGGGITFLSQEQEEYDELRNKIYVPTL